MAKLKMGIGKMRRVVMSIGFSALTLTVFAQPAQYRDRIFIDVAVSASSKNFATAASVFHMSPLIKSHPKLLVGYGLRFTGFVGANQYYTTAPSRFTSPIQNPGTIFSKTFSENIDTVTTATAITYSLNAVFHVQYRFSSKLSAGFNIDLAGLSFGPKREFNIISNAFDPGQSPVAYGKPTRFNLLLTSDNDFGSLNSEFYIQYMVNLRLGFRGGYTFLFSEYTTDEKLSFDQGRIYNDRYRYKASLILLGLVYRPF